MTDVSCGKGGSCCGNVFINHQAQYSSGPTTFFIDKKGIIQAMKVGAFSSKEEI
jgi:hypothetical protein